jgi:PKHD-type hydroxylase
MLKNFYSIYPGILPAGLCDYIVKTTPWNKHFKAELSEDNKDMFVDKTIRETDVVFLSPLSLIGCITQSYTRASNISAEWDFALDGFEEVQMGRYLEGGHYDWHIDSFVPNYAKQQRKLTAVAFLSDPDSYKGGEFELKVASDLPKKLPQGTLLIFPSVLEHRVTAVKSGERYTASCWAFGPAFK